MSKSALTAVVVAGLMVITSACTKEDATPTATTASPTGASTSTSSTTSASATPEPLPSSGPISALPTPYADDRGKPLDKADAIGGTEIENDGIITKIQVKPAGVVEAKAADLGGVKVSKDRVPYFVSMTYINAGTQVLEYPTLGSGLVVKDTSGGLLEALMTDKTIQGCPVPQPPEAFKPMTTITECQVYLVGKGDKIGIISYRDASGDRKNEIAWTINPVRKG